MIAERGYDAVTVRDLAEVCRVSVPTLYNQFGGKDQLLAAAIEEHFLFTQDTSAFRDAEPGFERLLVIIDQCADQLLVVPAYHQRLLEAFAALGSTQQVQERIAHSLAEVIAAELNGMIELGQISEWVAPLRLAGLLTSACIGTAVQWSAGFIDAESLKSNMRYAMGSALLGVVRGQPRDVIELRIREAQTILAAADLTVKQHSEID